MFTRSCTRRSFAPWPLTAASLLFVIACSEQSVSITSAGDTGNLLDPAVVLTPASRVFAAAEDGPQPAAKTVAITSTTTELSGLAVGTISYGGGQPTGWLITASLNTTTTPATLTLQPTPGSLAPGSYTATVPITAIGATNNPRNVTVTLNVTASPWITATPMLRTFAGAEGGPQPAAKTIAVTNGGTAGTTLSGLALGTISYKAGEPTGWLTTATLSPETAPATLTLRPTVGALVAGTYTVTVKLTSAVALNTPATVTVKFEVTASPWIAVSPASRTFAAEQSGPQPAAKTVSITNGGTMGTTLTGLAVGTITYGLGQPTGWLTTATLNTTTAPAILTLRPTTGTLPVGSYKATVKVTSSSALNSPVNVTALFNITAPNYDGTWTGTTSQGRAIGFTVVNHALASISEEYDYAGTCSGTTSLSRSYPTPVPFDGNAFTNAGSVPGPVATKDTVKATFGSSTAASGTGSFSIVFSFPNPACTAGATVTWTATRP